MNFSNCPECTRLWSALSHVTNEFFRLDGKLKIAQLQHDHDAIKQLTATTDRLTTEREQLRADLTSHERTHHPGVGAAKA